MLREWLAPLSLEVFVQDHLGQLPHAQPGAAAPMRHLLDWKVLADILATRPRDVLIARAGRLVDVAIPRDLAELRKLMDQGLGVVIRNSERQHRGLAELARAFAVDLPGEVHVQLYVTPAGTQTFGWHFDFEDVFIAQTVGIKDYYFRANTVSGELAAGTQPDFSTVRQEKSALFASQLIPGDWLYIPRRWWHLVRSVQDSLSISIGVLPEELRSRASVPMSTGVHPT
jgi:50S ribosomal protein L16 3-hydroxylase